MSHPSDFEAVVAHVTAQTRLVFNHYLSFCRIKSQIAHTKKQWEHVESYQPTPKHNVPNPTLLQVLQNRHAYEIDGILQKEYEERCESLFPVQPLRDQLKQVPDYFREATQNAVSAIQKNIMSQYSDPFPFFLLPDYHPDFGNVIYVFRVELIINPVISQNAIRQCTFYVIPSKNLDVVDNVVLEWDKVLETNRYSYPNAGFPMRKTGNVPLFLELNLAHWHDYDTLLAWLKS